MNDIDGIHCVHFPGRWLAGGELHVCAVQPVQQPLDALKSDAPRHNALALARELFVARPEEPAKLTLWTQDRPALVLFPELAFSSHDLAQLDSWIVDFPSPTLVLAGFGFSTGQRLRMLLEDGDCQSTWPKGRDLIDANRLYNGGWCWIHRPEEGMTRRLVFLKNMAEQKHEHPGVPKLSLGTHILRLDTDDLTVFPLICADIISGKENSPLDRIRASLSCDGLRDHRHVLVTGLLYENRTSSGFWKGALNDLV